MQQKTKTEQVQANGATQVFRDAATLLLLVLLAVSIRFDRPEKPAVEPLPGGVQAAELNEAAAAAEPAASQPSAACPKVRPAVLRPADLDVSLEKLERALKPGNRLLVLRDGKVHEIRLTKQFEVADPAPDCGDRRIPLVRS